MRKGISRITTSLASIKCYYGLNHYGQCNTEINQGTTEKECPCCLETESWEYIIQCSIIRYLRPKFVIELYKELKKEQAKDIGNHKLRAIIHDIRVFIRNDSDPEYETSQGDLGMKWLFCGIIVKEWFGTNFRITKYCNYNKIII